MKKILTLATVAVALTLGACAAPKSQHSAKDVESAILAAEHETSRAKKKNYEWRDTGKMIKKAKAELKKAGEAKKKGDAATEASSLDEAYKLAVKAKAQSTMALQQYADQKDAAMKH